MCTPRKPVDMTPSHRSSLSGNLHTRPPLYALSPSQEFSRIMRTVQRIESSGLLLFINTCRRLTTSAATRRSTIDSSESKLYPRERTWEPSWLRGDYCARKFPF